MRRTIRGGAVVASLFGLGAAAGQQPAAPQPPAAQAPTAPRPAPPAPDTVVATVNGEVIRLAEVDAILTSKFPLPSLTGAQTRQMRADILHDLVDDLLLRQFLRKHGPKVEPAEVEQHLRALGESLARQNKTLADFFRETGQTEAQARETWTTLMQLGRYVKERVTDEQLRQYYQANKDVFDRVEVRASHIVIRVGPAAPPAERAAARDRLRALRAEILAGRISFEDAARKYSQCPSAPQGGDLGFILRKGMIPDEPFCKAAFALKPGEVSDVVEADFGVHLIRVTGRKPGAASTFEKCVEDVRESFTDDFRAELIAKLRKQAQIQISVP